ncbi:hypothetical protein V6N11_059948 [Hibiscus sabdariffa]|uniref:Uncharacterized protein n=2 Tax=Hibiscus sabdariffa TaxID=183260 RepID=A0ABR2NZ05_9ROSI
MCSSSNPKQMKKICRIKMKGDFGVGPMVKNRWPIMMCRLPSVVNRGDQGIQFVQDQYEWYIDLCRHVTVERSGFGLRLDLVVLLTTGLTDIRDSS